MTIESDDATNNGEVAQPINPLLVELSDLQMELLDLICLPLSPVGGPWPTWDFISRELGRNRSHSVDAGAVLRSLPRIPVPEATRSYGLVWPIGMGASDPEESAPIGLTIAGLVQLGRLKHAAAVLADRASGVVEWLATKERNLKSDPKGVVSKEVQLDGLDYYLQSSPDFPFNVPQGVLTDLLKHEYVTIWLNDQTAPPRAALTRWLRPFLGSPTAESYLRVLGGAYSVARPAPRLRGDELALMLDYTSHVLVNRSDWNVGHLASRPDFRTAAALSADVYNEAEFRTRLGDLATILSRLNVPRPSEEALKTRGLNAGVGPLVALKIWVEENIHEPGDPMRASNALEEVRSVIAIRNEFEHPSDRTRANGRAARAALGVPDPINDWGEAWNLIRARVADAFDVVRNEADDA